MPVLVNSMLKGEGRMDGAKLWPVACLGGRPQLHTIQKMLAIVQQVWVTNWVVSIGTQLRKS